MVRTEVKFYKGKFYEDAINLIMQLQKLNCKKCF